MKDDTRRVLEHVICDDELSRIRNWMMPLNTSKPVELDSAIMLLSGAASQITLKNHEQAGIYHLYLGCLFYEKADYQNAIQHAQSAIHEMWNTPINKALACWLLGLCFSAIGEFPNARHELQEALHLLATNLKINSPRANREKLSRRTIQQDIENTLEKLFQKPLFREIEPDPVRKAERFPLQDPPAYDENGTSISIQIPISITSESNPVNTNSFNLPAEKIVESQNEPAPENESRTDQPGFMVLPSLPIYDQKLRAGKSGEPEIGQYSNQYAEIEFINFEGKPHRLHSLKSQSKINPASTGEWGWMKVLGNSMNNIKGRVSIQNDDYVLIQKHSNPNENEIVVAFRLEIGTNETFFFVKRYKKELLMLYSETTEKGMEYDPIDIYRDGVSIYGIVHAVAKPVKP